MERSAPLCCATPFLLIPQYSSAPSAPLFRQDLSTPQSSSAPPRPLLPGVRGQVPASSERLRRKPGPFAVIVRGVVAEGGQAPAPALGHPVHIGKGCGQFNGQQVQFPGCPRPSGEQVASFVDEIVGRAELLFLDPVGDAGGVSGPVARQEARLPVRAGPRQQPDEDLRCSVGHVVNSLVVEGHAPGPSTTVAGVLFAWSEEGLPRSRQPLRYAQRYGGSGSGF